MASEGQLITTLLIRLLDRAEEHGVVIMDLSGAPVEDLAVSWWTDEGRHVTYTLSPGPDGWEGVPVGGKG